MKHCQECNLDFPDSYRFCGSCGGAISHALSCQGCGELVESKWTFCTNCGKGLSAESPNSQASRSKAPEFQDVPAALPIPVVAASQTMPAPVPGHRGNGAPKEWYAVPDLFGDVDETTAASSLPRELIPKTKIAVPITPDHRQFGNGKEPPTLTMLSTYGDSGTGASPEWQRHHLLLGGLLLLVFFGVLGFGGWYWWAHRATVTQSPAAQSDSHGAPNATDPSASASIAAPTIATARTTSGVEEEWKRLRERRIGAKSSETGEIIAAFEGAEKKYPNDYRFPYERAKLSIKGITSHHEAFGALSLAAVKAIDNGKAREMLDSLMADKDGDFYKPAHGHREWQTLVQALSNKDKKGLRDLHH